MGNASAQEAHLSVVADNPAVSMSSFRDAFIPEIYEGGEHGVACYGDQLPYPPRASPPLYRKYA